jgi:hypothetical protein
MAAPQKYRKIRAFATFSPPRGIDKRVYLVLRMLRRGIKGYCSMNETIEKPSWIGDAILLQQQQGADAQANLILKLHVSEAGTSLRWRHIISERPQCFAIQSSPMYVYALLTAYGMVFSLKIFLDIHEI